MSDLVKNIKDSEFENEVLDSKNGLVLVDFFAPWCGPCVQLSPNLEALASEVNVLKIVKINVDENNQYASQYGVRSIPNLILFKNGEKVEETVGFKTLEQLKELIAKHK